MAGIAIKSRSYNDDNFTLARIYFFIVERELQVELREKHCTGEQIGRMEHKMRESNRIKKLIIMCVIVF